MTLEVRPIDFGDAGLRAQCIELEQKVFNSAEITRSMLDHILVASHEQTLFLGCFDGERVVGLNGFIAHPVCRNGDVSIAYQSCLSATDPDYRGRGIFTSLIDKAKQTLTDRGGAFLFGYPNESSGPIFTRKLGFSENQLSIVYLPVAIAKHTLRPFIDMEKFCAVAAESTSLITFDAYETARWKRERYGDELVRVEYLTNFIFGRVEERRSGFFTVRIFDVGGYEINKPPLLKPLIAKIGRKTRAHVVRFIVPPCAALVQATRYRRAGKSTEPLITFPLNWDVEGCCVEAWTGLKDVY